MSSVKKGLSASILHLSPWPLFSCTHLGFQKQWPDGQTSSDKTFPKAVTSCDQGPLTNLEMIINHFRLTDSEEPCKLFVSAQVVAGSRPLDLFAMLDEDSLSLFIVIF